jgi:hypothetical protein
MAVLHNHRPTSLKTASRTGDRPDFDCAWNSPLNASGQIEAQTHNQ